MVTINWQYDPVARGGRHRGLLSVAADEVQSVLRSLQRRQGMAVAGFRAGRVPAALFYRLQRKAVDAHFIHLVRRELPEEAAKLLEQAAVPPEFKALGLTAEGKFEVEAAWFRLPAPPDARGQLGALAGPAPGEGPELPALAPPPLEQFLPKIETPLLAEHNLALGRQLDPRGLAAGRTAAPARSAVPAIPAVPAGGTAPAAAGQRTPPGAPLPSVPQPALPEPPAGPPGAGPPAPRPAAKPQPRTRPGKPQPSITDSHSKPEE
jgi:hypothetical protein